jgi:hypothetical protein
VNNSSSADLFHNQESSQVDSPVKIYQLPVSEQDWAENGVDFSGKSADSLTKQERKTLSLKMFLAYFPQITEETWPLSLKRWSSAGIASPTGCLMLNTSEFPNAAVECSLSDVLETQGDHLKKYSLSPKAAQGILRRAGRREKTLPIQLQKALEKVANNELE